MVENIEVQAEFKETEVGLIPEDWEVKLLADISDVKTGPFGSALHEKDYVQNGTPIITVEHLGEQGVVHENLPQVSDLDKARLKAYVLKKGDIVFSRVGSVDRNSLVSAKEDGWLFSGRLLRIRLNNPKVHPSYLSYHFHQESTKGRIRSVAVGQTMASLNTKILKGIHIVLPPTLAEQTAIATALNDADALITQLEKLIAKKRAIKQGTMQELLKPKEGWEVKRLGEVANIRRGASPRPIKDPKWFSSAGRGWIRISDVTSSNVYLKSTTQYLSEEGVKNSVPVDPGDLIMSICATIGVPIVIDIPACIHDGFVLFKNYEKVLDTFFLYFFLQQQTENLASKGQPGTQVNLNTSIVNNLEIAFPNISQQKKIGSMLKDIDIEIATLEKKLVKYQRVKQGMMQNLLTGKIRLV